MSNGIRNSIYTVLYSHFRYRQSQRSQNLYDPNIQRLLHRKEQNSPRLVIEYADHSNFWILEQ